jgi:hypothetical protein
LKKLRIYARERVSHAWLVDPIARTLEVLRLEHDRWSIVVVSGANEIAHAEPFDTLELSLRDLWADDAG